MCRSVIGLAHAYGMRCIAEAVEHLDQVEFLREAQCDEVQGALFGEPMLREDLVLFLDSFHATRERRDA